MDSNRNITTTIEEHKRRLAFGMFARNDPSTQLDASTTVPLLRSVWVEDFLSLYPNVVIYTRAVDRGPTTVTQNVRSEQEAQLTNCATNRT